MPGSFRSDDPSVAKRQARVVEQRLDQGIRAVERIVPRMLRRHSGILAGIALAALWSVVGLGLLRDYGPTWDCTIGEYPLGESLLHAMTSDASLREAPLHATIGNLRAPHPAFNLELSWHVCWPLASTLSAASCRLFWTELDWMPAMAAHNLPIVLLVAVLIVCIVRWMTPRAGVLTALFASLFLMTSPRFFADSFNNLKDTPEAVLYTIALLVAARAVRIGGIRSWLAAGVLCGAALAQKANAIFLPIEVAGWVLVSRWMRVPARDRERRPHEWRDVMFGLIAAIVAYFALSPQFWFDTIDRLTQHYTHIFRTGNIAFRAADIGQQPSAANLRVDLDGVMQAVTTTPIPVLLLFIVGLFAPTLSRRDRALLAIGTVLPVGRTLIPGMVNFDGVRHFDEFLPPMCLLAASGLSWLAERVTRWRRLTSRRALARVVANSLLAAAISPGAWATLRTHPNGTVYFNALVGGLSGAQHCQLRDATDYWGNSYWQAIDWLNVHAESGASILSPVAGHIVRAIAPVRLRSDLHAGEPDDGGRNESLYVVYITRRGWYDRALVELDQEVAPVHTICVDGAPILKILRFAAGEEATRARERLVRSQRAVMLRNRIAAWVQRDPRLFYEIERVLAGRATAGDEATLNHLRAILPPKLHPGLEDFLRELDPGPGFPPADSPSDR